jgi:Tfp pilus assembly protein PilF
MKASHTLKLIGFLALSSACSRPVSEERHLEAQTLFEVGISQLQDGDFPNAIANLEGALEHRPDSHDIELHLGLAYLGAKTLDKAEQHMKRACGMIEKYALCWNNLAGIHLAQGRYAEASAAADKAIEVVTFSAPHLSWGNKGDALFHLGNLKGSRQALMKALKAQPQHCRNRALLSRTLLQLADFDNARQQGLLLRRFCPAEPRILLWEGYLSYRLGFISETKKTFDAIINGFSDKDAIEAAQRGLKDLENEKSLTPPEL